VGSGKYLSVKEFRGLKEFEKHCITLYMVAWRRNSDKEEHGKKIDTLQKTGEY
jgi:hypothetical protein